jgi:hypothetical protein
VSTVTLGAALLFWPLDQAVLKLVARAAFARWRAVVAVSSLPCCLLAALSALKRCRKSAARATWCDLLVRGLGNVTFVALMVALTSNLLQHVATLLGERSYLPNRQRSARNKVAAQHHKLNIERGEPRLERCASRSPVVVPPPNARAIASFGARCSPRYEAASGASLRCQ